MYVKIQNVDLEFNDFNYPINISSSAKFSELKDEKLTPYQLRELVDSTIFQYGKIHG